MSLTLDQIRAALPEGGLFEGNWQYSPEPLKLTKAEGRFLQSLGHPLAQFQRACDDLYRRSATGKMPRWIAELLDTGKPAWMAELQRQPEFRDTLPRVIRPDLILMDDGKFSLTELDSVPGGLGITAWLSRTYAEAGFNVLGGGDGMLAGFSSVLPEGGAILIAEEAADYRRELEWLARGSGGGRTVEPAEEYQPDERALYRFFEWFDWESVPEARHLAEKSAAGEIRLTPPCKPHLEDKLWLALLWTPALKPIWEQALRGSHLSRVRDIVPHGWVVDPSPLPPQAALPVLGVNSWDEVAAFSQKQRRLVLKISGFHETAWGSRGVHVGHDLSQADWAERIRIATEDFDQQPWIMQSFSEGRLIEHPVFREDGSVYLMKGRVRLCPYYFTDDQGKTSLAGALATLAPADKKKIHGMRDAVLLPCVIG
ncbi:hypothetical protein OKA05_07965 [Luteolibacter arcticus]|uniref:Glutathionylspermidine synthase pre-ATP-grasp-like domain-containing protein n=1 Tax=Luteolibacter arcticus TaxID=1581411 RepID=A0ABT3GFT2_9BACT|nr:hypothetical protein [Luteolibacter arcticus]MCW1922487.1 hypothetical protein [Luteolibacter arcticus]